MLKADLLMITKGFVQGLEGKNIWYWRNQWNRSINGRPTNRSQIHEENEGSSMDIDELDRKSVV